MGLCRSKNSNLDISIEFKFCLCCFLECEGEANYINVLNFRVLSYDGNSNFFRRVWQKIKNRWLSHLKWLAHNQNYKRKIKMAES